MSETDTSEGHAVAETPVENSEEGASAISAAHVVDPPASAPVASSTQATNESSPPASQNNQPASAPASAGQATVAQNPVNPAAPDMDRLHVRLTHPQLAGGVTPRLVHVDGNTGQVRLDLGRGNVVTVPLQHQQSFNRHNTRISVNHVFGPPPASDPTVRTNVVNSSPTTAALPGNVNIRVSHLHPLQPQPVQESSSAQANLSADSSNEEALARFKCSLCYEFMKDPVGCPSETCSARFCHACLLRAVMESRQGSTAAANMKPKCPTCRVEFEHMVRDERLMHEMYNGPTVACRHEECPEQNLRLPNVQDHEKLCAFEKVRCRYESFGCPWVGKRGDLADHEARDCALDKVKVLVDKFRRMEMDHSNRLSILQQQNHGSLHMMQIYRQNAQRDLIKSTSNLFDLFHYCHVVTCSTNHFLQTKERWSPFYRSNEGHAAVVNLLVLLPTVLTCGNLCLLGVQSLLKFCFDERKEPASSMAARALDFLLEDGVVGILLGLLTTLSLVANFVDTKSSVTWGAFPFPGMGSPPVMCDVISVSLFTMHVGLLEYFGAAGKSLVVWLLLATASTFYPGVVLSISHGAAKGLTSTPVPTISNILGKARALEPVLFGLRFCLVGTLFGSLPTLDAVAMTALIQPILRQQHPPSDSNQKQWMSLLQMKNGLFESLPRSFLLAYLGAKAAMLAVQFQHWKDGGDWKEQMMNAVLAAQDSSLLWSLVDSILAFVMLLATTALLNGFLSLGLRMGNVILNQAETTNSLQNRPDGSAPARDYQLLGLASFGVWFFLLGVLLHVR